MGYVNPPSSDADSTVEYQNAFKNIRDKYAAHELPARFRLNTDRTGVKREDQPKLNIITSCSKYSETLLKIVAEGDESQSLDAFKRDIFMAAAAQQKYLQSEYSAVLIDGSFDPQVSKFYRQLR